MHPYESHDNNLKSARSPENNQNINLSKYNSIQGEFSLKIFYSFVLITRLLGRFALIFYLNCEHVLFVYILKQRRKKFCGFKKKFADFQKKIFL